MFLKVLVLLSLVVLQVKALNDQLEWTGGSFDFPSYYYIQKNIPENAIGTRFQVYKDNIYVAFPRYKPGIPVTLAKVSTKPHKGESVLSPFPDWESQNEDRCEGLHSIVDIFVDAHHILWALDTGVVNVLEEPLRKSPPRVVAFDVDTGKKVRTLDLSGLVVQASRLQYVIVDHGSDGRSFVYITDAATRSIIVFDVIGGTGYRLVLPKAITSGNKRDVLYAALVHKNCGSSQLLLSYLSGNRIFSINTNHIRSGLAMGNIEDLGTKDGRIIFLGTDGGSAVFYRYEGKSKIYKWDTNDGRLHERKLVYTSPSCYLATEVVPDGQRVRVLESNFLDYLQGTVGCGASQRIISVIMEH